MTMVSEFHRDDPHAVRIFTGTESESQESHALFEMSAPNAEGLRSIRRAKDDPYLGKILGITEAPFRGTVSPTGVFAGTKNVEVRDEYVRVGQSMGLQPLSTPDESWRTRPVLSIEVLDE